MRDAVDSLYNGALTGQRAQTVLTPVEVVDALRLVFDGPIGFDPVWAPGSHTNPERMVELPWAEIWAYALTVAQESSGGDDRLVAEAMDVVHARTSGKDSVPAARDLAKRVIAAVRLRYGPHSGHRQPWPDRTYVNPPFGDRGPETILATFRDFCATFAACQSEVALLCPVRCHRKWWRRDVLRAANAVVFLNPLKFDGFAQTFPAPLCLAYKGPAQGVERLAPSFKRLGDTVIL